MPQTNQCMDSDKARYSGSEASSATTKPSMSKISRKFVQPVVAQS